MKTKSKTKNMNRIWIGIGIAMVALLLVGSVVSAATGPIIPPQNLDKIPRYSGSVVSAATGLTIPYIAVDDQNWNAKKIFNTGDEARFVVYVNNPSTSPDSVTLKFSVISGNGYTLLSSSPWTVTIPGKSTPGYAWAITIPTNAPTGIYYYTATVSDSQGSVTGYAVFQISGPMLPVAPSNLRVTPLNGNSIILNWNDNSNNENGFEISNGVTSVKVGANTNSYTWGGLTPGKYMCFMVRAYNTAGSSAWTPYACTTTLTYKTVPVGSLGLDYSFARPNIKDIADKGYKFVARYLSYDTRKNIDANEYSNIKNRNMVVVLVWESTAKRPLDGYNAGVSDAKMAVSQAASIGAPKNVVIYFAVDFDAYESQQNIINNYLNGAASVIGKNRMGVYGGYYVVKRAMEAGVATYGWQTIAWSGGQIYTGANIYQNGKQDFCSANSCNADIDVALKLDIGAS